MENILDIDPNRKAREAAAKVGRSDPIEQIMGQMERAEPTENNSPLENFGREYEDVIFRAGIEAQCLKLAKDGWRKAPSEEEIYAQLCRAYNKARFDVAKVGATKREYVVLMKPVALELNKLWLMGKQKEPTEAK